MKKTNELTVEIEQERERERESKQITKTKDCSASDCINRYIKKGASGSICANCQEELKKFVARLK